MKCEENEEETRVLRKAASTKQKEMAVVTLAGEHCVAMEEMRGREEEGEEERRVQAKDTREYNDDEKCDM